MGEPDIREQVARIVDPVAFEEHFLEDGRTDPEVAGLFEDAVEEARAKAERIVTLLAAPATPAEESSVEAQPSGYSTPIDVGIGAPSPVECQWPAGLMFGFHDEPGEHDPCYVIMPGGAMLPFNHHAEPGVDIARARFVQIACNAMLAGRTEAGWQPRPGAVVHDVKCWPEFFKAIADGRKPWELRNNDRGYQAGDIMRIREWEPGAQSYTGAELWRGVPFVLHGAGDWLPVGKCIMSLADYAPAEARSEQAECSACRDTGPEGCGVCNETGLSPEARSEHPDGRSPDDTPWKRFRDEKPTYDGWGERYLLTWNVRSATYDHACIDGEWRCGEEIDGHADDLWRWLDVNPERHPPAALSESSKQPPLDLAWAAVNVLGAPNTACRTAEDLAYCRGIGDALAEIEKLGGQPS